MIKTEGNCPHSPLFCSLAQHFSMLKKEIKNELISLHKENFDFLWRGEGMLGPSLTQKQISK